MLNLQFNLLGQRSCVVNSRNFTHPKIEKQKSFPCLYTIVLAIKKKMWIRTFE